MGSKETMTDRRKRRSTRIKFDRDKTAPLETRSFARELCVKLEPGYKPEILFIGSFYVW